MARMADPTRPAPVKMICGIISWRAELMEQAIEILSLRLGPVERISDVLGQMGPVEMVSDIMNFDFTHYYDQEMGSPLYRRFVAMERLVEPDCLVDAKLATNEIEKHFAQMSAETTGPARPINLDPGYIASSKLVLASMKDFSHRIYLGRGVYGDLTLMYHKERWAALPWTFPDYASGRYQDFLLQVRHRLRSQLAQEVSS